MPQYVAPTSNVLIFTDYHFCAGGITDGRTPATALSQGSVLLLKDVFFPTTTESGGVPRRTLARTISARFSNLSEADAQRVGASFADDIPHITSVDNAPPLGEVSIDDYLNNGTINLGGGTTTFRPAGRTYSRTIGQFRVVFSVGAESLSGIVKADSTLNAVRFDDTGTRVLLQPQPRSGCHVCGACGACILCAEVNYSVGAVALSAVALIAAPHPDLPPFTSDVPDPPPPDSAGRVPQAELAAEIRKRIRPLLDIPDLIAGKKPDRREP